MPDWYPIQHDFSGGEISPRMVMRTDTSNYAKSLSTMYNFIPTLQGPAQRAPGSSFITRIGEVQRVRLIDYLSTQGRPSIVQLTNELATIYEGVADVSSLSAGSAPGATSDDLLAVETRGQIITNSEFINNLSNWVANVVLAYPAWSPLSQGSVALLCYHSGVNIDNDLSTQDDVVTPTDKLTIQMSVNFVPFFEGIELSVGTVLSVSYALGTAPGLDDIDSGVLATSTYKTLDLITHVDPPAPAWTGTVYVTITSDTTGTIALASLKYFRVYTVEPNTTIVEQVVAPYLEADLDDIHYVQSPYTPHQLVMVHKDYPPHWLYYDDGLPGYVVEPITFVEPPAEWVPGNYPSTCTAYQGRLILGGSPQQSETAWGTEPGKWDTFTAAPATPADSIEYTTIYRSPIQWLFGHKNLMTGCIALEYAVTSQQGVLAPDDLQVTLHTTHGGAHVQPVGFGQYVLFAGERGTRLRALQTNESNQGWIAPDLSLLAEHLTSTGIRRLVRMRNPHQMCVCLTNNGTLAILHQDNTAGISGWSRMDVMGEIKDIAVMTNSTGLDVLYLAVDRTNNGVKYTDFEAIYSWELNSAWNYTAASTTYVFDEPTTTITGLDQLSGLAVQVVGDGSYLGEFQVIDGVLGLENDAGQQIFVSIVTVGRLMPCKMRTLPAISTETTGGAGSKKRHSNIGVRTIGSARPIINGERPPDRDPQSAMNISQPLDELMDNEVVGLGWDKYSIITVEEVLPIKVEVAGIYGKLSSKNL